MDSTETDDEALIGDIAHIIGEKTAGPRGTHPLPMDKRNLYGNLVLLCKNHHKLVDDQEGIHTVEALQRFKSEHEQWVRTALPTFDPTLQFDKERYASYIGHWSTNARLNDWDDWTSGLLSMGQPSLAVEDDARLFQLRLWLFNRIWPERFTDLEESFHNFRIVLHDLQELFRIDIDRHGDMLWTKKRHQIQQWDEERYERLLKQYNHHVDLIQDLTLELTRAANYICDRIRARIDPLFRLDEGLLTVIRDPDNSFSSTRLRPQYRADERVGVPYKGLKSFEIDRAKRDVHIGAGESEH